MNKHLHITALGEKWCSNLLIFEGGRKPSSVNNKVLNSKGMKSKAMQADFENIFPMFQLLLSRPMSLNLVEKPRR